MDFSLQNVIEAFYAMPLWEVVAVLLDVGYVILVAKESALAWIFAFFKYPYLYPALLGRGINILFTSQYL
jgi:hypothetical protein